MNNTIKNIVVAVPSVDTTGKRFITYDAVSAKELVELVKHTTVFLTEEEVLEWLKVQTCILCEEPATWERCTQFAGNHPYCEKHAIMESDFGTDDQDTYWIQLRKE
jgi:hypothetical protein